MDEHAHRFAGGVPGIESEQRSQEVGAVRQARRLLVNHFDLVALQYGHIHELFGFIAAAVLNNQQTGRHHLENEARLREIACGAPDEEQLTVAPDAEVNARSLHGGRKPRERLRRQRQGPLKFQGPFYCFRCNEGERDARHVAFLATKAGPEGRFDDCLNRGGVRRRGRFSALMGRECGEVSLEMSTDSGSRRPRCRVPRLRHRVAPRCKYAVADPILVIAQGYLTGAMHLKNKFSETASPRLYGSRWL